MDSSNVVDNRDSNNVIDYIADRIELPVGYPRMARNQGATGYGCAY